MLEVEAQALEVQNATIDLQDKEWLKTEAIRIETEIKAELAEEEKLRKNIETLIAAEKIAQAQKITDEDAAKVLVETKLALEKTAKDAKEVADADVATELTAKDAAIAADTTIQNDSNKTAAEKLASTQTKVAA